MSDDPETRAMNYIKENLRGWLIAQTRLTLLDAEIDKLQKGRADLVAEIESQEKLIGQLKILLNLFRKH